MRHRDGIITLARHTGGRFTLLDFRFDLWCVFPRIHIIRYYHEYRDILIRHFGVMMFSISRYGAPRGVPDIILLPDDGGEGCAMEALMAFSLASMAYVAMSLLPAFSFSLLRLTFTRRY